MSYVGGPGCTSSIMPTDQCVTLYDALMGAGAAFGFASDAGVTATIDAPASEAGRRASGRGARSDETPPRGRTGLRGQVDASCRSSDAMVLMPVCHWRQSGCVMRLTILTAFPWGGEPMPGRSENVGEL